VFCTKLVTFSALSSSAYAAFLQTAGNPNGFGGDSTVQDCVLFDIGSKTLTSFVITERPCRVNNSLQAGTINLDWMTIANNP
jgi:hypothetical protein